MKFAVCSPCRGHEWNDFFGDLFLLYLVCSSHTYLMLHMKVTEGAKNLVLPSGPYLAGDQG